MSQQYPALIIVVPLIAALIVALMGRVDRRWCFPLSLFSLFVAMVTGLALLAGVLENGPVSYRLAGWEPPMGIEYYVDYLNGVVLVLITFVALINLITARRWVDQDPAYREGPFYSVYILSVTGLMGMVVTGDAFNLYVLLEISSLSGYALVGMARNRRSSFAALRYVFLGTIGASFYLLGVGVIYMMTGTLNMQDMALRLVPMYDTGAVMVAFLLVLVGIWIKAAFYPLHSWLPGAYTYSPAPAAGLLAPLMTKVMIYVMLRFMFTVFTPSYSFGEIDIAQVVVWLATIAILAGGIMALSVKNMRTMLCFIIVSEVGYMVGGAWLGNADGLTGAILHLVGDALMTLCLFLAASAIAFRQGGVRLVQFHGLFVKQPFTMGALCVAAMAIIGVPPTCGFYSKWYLLSGGLAAGAYGYVAALIISSLISVVLFFRIFELAFYTSGGLTHDHGHGHTDVMAEAPPSLVAPLIFTAGCLIVLGLGSGWVVYNLIGPFLPAAWL